MKKSFLILVLLLGARSEAFGQWAHTSGPYGGPIFCFGKHNHDLFATSYNDNADGRIFRSTDNGLSWFQTSFNVPQVSVVSIVSIGTNVIAGSANGIYLSTDDGNTWSASDSGLTQPTVECLAIIGSIVFAVTSEGIIYRSFDNGRSWHSNGNGLKSAGLTNLFVMGSKILVESEQGLYFSTDSGANWQGPTNNRESLFATQGSKLFALSDSGIVVSTDTGTTWEIADTSLFRKTITSIVIKDSNIFVGTYGGIFLSTNGGINWQAINTELIAIRGGALMVSDSIILAGTGSGVFRTANDGVSWTNTGVPEFTATFLASAGPYLFSDENGSAPYFISSNGGESWTERMDVAAGTIVSIGTCFIATNYNNSLVVMISTDSGNTWSQSNPIASSSGISSLASIDSNLFALTEMSIFLSTDFGTSWQDVGESLGINNLNNVSSWVYAMDAADSDLYIFGYSSYLSTDLGLDWTKINVAVTPSIQWTAPTFTQCEADVFVVGRFEGIMRSTDNGITWQGANTGLPDSTAISSLASRDNYVFAGSVDRGIFVSSNFGATWTAMNSGLTDTEIFSLAVKDSFLYAGTASSGVWRYSLSDLPTLSYILDVKGSESDTIFFDTIPVGGTSLRSVTEFNAGNAELTVQAIQAPQNDFVTSDVSSPVTLDSGESSIFEVYFQPTTPGLHSAELHLQSEAREVTIYLSGLATGQANVKSSSLQTDFLLKAYPNPLSLSTTIRFTSAESGDGKVTILNLLGEEVARVFKGALTSGEHSFLWSKPTGLPDGTYECVVEINGSVKQLPIVVTSEP